MPECWLHPLEGSAPRLSDVWFSALFVMVRYDEAKNTMKKHGIKADNVSYDLKGIMKSKEKAVCLDSERVLMSRSVS